MASIKRAPWWVIMLGIVIGFGTLVAPSRAEAATRSAECSPTQPPKRPSPSSTRVHRSLADALRAVAPKDNLQGIELHDVVVDEAIDFRRGKIAVPVTFRNVVFSGAVNLAGSHFTRGLDLRGSTFLKPVDLSGAKVDGDLSLRRARFARDFDAGRMTVSGFLSLREACFWETVDVSDSRVTSGLDARNARFFAVACRDERGPLACADFSGMRIDGTADIRRTRFLGWMDFSETTIAGSLLAHGATFLRTTRDSHFANFGYMRVQGPANFDGASFLTGVSFMHSSFASLGLTATFNPPVSLGGMIYSTMAPPSVPARRNDLERALTLLGLAEYDGSNYTTLEAMFQRQGYPEWANQVYIDRKARERTDGRLSVFAVIWNWTLWAFVGYGRRPWLAWVWSLGFVVAGAFMFRREHMVTVGQLQPRPYQPFWYSLDLFAPVIDLGMAKAWAPEWHHHRSLATWSHVWQLAGWLFVPLGLAAWTGLVK